MYALKKNLCYFELKILWEELEIYMPIPSCSCSVMVCFFWRLAWRSRVVSKKLEYPALQNSGGTSIGTQYLQVWRGTKHCLRCSSHATCSSRQNHTLLYAIRFLTGLNDNFAMVKSQNLLLDPLPSMNKILSMVIQHERQNNFAPLNDSKVLITVIDNQKLNSKYNESSSYTLVLALKWCKILHPLQHIKTHRWSML